MSLTIAQSLRSLALGQAMMVAPALGESYEGKTAGTIAALLLMLADDAETRTARDNAARDALLALFETVQAETPRALLRDALADGSNKALWNAFIDLHAYADAGDAELAACCRVLLLEWTERERLRPPVL
ncbi:hypothetical protein [Sandaracinobacteroides hominis]|uniref:hypothetical protein n=1 Tax=Sandaracinobacteroides hominis TaxID=2780086 RepID=UPI0018F68B2B|nr:hypothetical protein [Sandaracinobacteroides hominis]